MLLLVLTDLVQVTDRNLNSTNTLGWDQKLLDLTDLNPGNSLIGNNETGATVRVTNTVGGLVSGEDRVLVGPWDGSTTDSNGDPAFEKDQLSLAVILDAEDETSVVVSEAIPSDTPSTGYIRVTDDLGFERRLHYTSWDTSTFCWET